MTAVVNIRGKLRKKWPCIAMVGEYWAVTVPVASGCKPWRDAPFVCITHQPTGLKAAEVSGDKALRCAKRFAKLFGNARTVRGVMRKHSQLPESDKRWIQRQRYSWINRGGR